MKLTEDEIIEIIMMLQSYNDDSHDKRADELIKKLQQEILE